MLGIAARTWSVLLIGRIFLNLSYRVTYPFLPAIARGLGIPFEQAGILVAARSFVGLSGIFFGVWTERKGYRWGMALGLLFLAAGCFVIAGSSTFAWVLAGFLALGLAKAVYDPSVQSYVSAHVDYSQRARGIGILESAWAGSWFFGIPVSGLLIARFGWQSPFWLMGGAAAVFFAATLRIPDSASPSAPIPRPTAEVPLREDAGEPPPSGGKPALVLLVTFCMLFANENLMIVYGAWLEKTFALEVQSLGLFSMLMGVSEFGGEMTVAALVDRIGKRRALTGGLILSGLSYLGLCLCQGDLALALMGLMVMFFTFEFTIVSSFPYVSELVPARRGKWLAANYTFAVAGRLVGALSGPWLWNHHPKLWLHASMSTAANFAALILLMAASRRTSS